MTDDVIIAPQADSEIWRGAVAWEERDGRARAWRLLPERAARAHAPELVRHATMAAGVRALVTTDASEARLELDFEHDADARLDVLLDGELYRRVEVTSGLTDLRVPLPDGEHDLAIWLPQVGQSWVGPLTLVGASTAAPTPPAAPRWTTYGSSITQCSAADGPSETWPAVAARALGWDLTCLGFGGQCHLDPIAASTIAAVPADVVSMCLGINIYGGATFSPRTFAAHASAFVERVRAAHPDATLVVITPIASPARETTPNAVDFTLEQMREDLRSVVDVLQAEGDANLHLVDGLSLLGLDEVHLLPDALHPDGEGYRLMGERVALAMGALTGAAPATVR
ncbi:lipolytic protein G-D-S-L family [Beutenbergia cavernae DSM 12333]|uniref:Lipolytic protein G-D-S-L family n=1 Tax=Beutenbergia cavernae (strain ATCC BAA-8 / DSM 12333 / CCUG 43141 / JCM 11478 / NBRC 16432 / NCIMB 13614 / HKI 0122) TaxID=471853 RepID=C5BVJ8_BEUC1|nr:GDSL-type esterase/lipase family protein [Beutenbergia cavernae]ACQ78438.1 lipolytic protein G-D-S-L family [Beutenbergia cavernae DSM 12333]